MASTEKHGKPNNEGQRTLFQGKNIHSSPVDGKLLCSFSEKTCMQRRLNQYAFCIRHVLEDKNAPFKQCKFVAKYNGQRCTNAIPVKEERIYCNSHLQVLGIVPKKSRKKKAQDNNESKHVTKTPKPDIILPLRISQNTISKRSEKAVVTQKPSTDERNMKKAKVLSSNPLLHELVSTYSEASNDKRDLFSYYGFSSSDEESQLDEVEYDCQNLSRNSSSSVATAKKDSSEPVEQSPRATKLWQLRKRLRAELFGVRRAIHAYNRDVKQSSKALGLLLTSVKASPSLTAVAIQNDKDSLSVSSRKRSAVCNSAHIFCTIKVDETTKCERKAIPYTKYCSRHITNDNKQLLFQQCSTELPPGSKCVVPTFDLIHHQPLCREHANPQVPFPQGQVLYNKQPCVPDVPVAVQKPPAKKPRRKPQVRALPTQKTVKPNKKTTKKESHKAIKSEKNKKATTIVPGQLDSKHVLENTANHVIFEKSREQFVSRSLTTTGPKSVDYLSNGNLKMEPLCANNEINVFGSNEFKEPGLFGSHEMEVEESLENDVLNMPEDLCDISPTGMLRDSVLKLPLELSESRENSPVKLPRKSPVDAFSINSDSEGNLHKPITSTNRVELARKHDHLTNNKQYDVPGRVNQMNQILTGVRPSRSSVITLPKFLSNPPVSPNLQRQNMPISSAEYNSFTPIAANIVKTEPGARKPEHRAIEVNHGPTLFPVQFDTMLNPTAAWGTGGGKFVINNRSRPLLINAPINHATFSPSSISPISPQITLGTAFNFDRPSVLQHSNSSSPTLSAYNSTLPNSPHRKLVPRTIRLDNRGNANPNDIIDPFFGASFDKP